MMSLTSDLLTQVSDSGPYGPHIYFINGEPIYEIE